MREMRETREIYEKRQKEFSLSTAKRRTHEERRKELLDFLDGVSDEDFAEHLIGAGLHEYYLSAEEK